MSLQTMKTKLESAAISLQRALKALREASAGNETNTMRMQRIADTEMVVAIAKIAEVIDEVKQTNA